MKNLINNSFIKNIFGIGAYRALTVVTNLLLIGLIFRYFDNEELNGIWLTVFSILSWLAIFDFGLGNGLRNKLTEAISKNEEELSRKYITTTYIIMIVPMITIILLSSIFIFSIDWLYLLKVTNREITNNYLALFFVIITVLYSINFYLSIIFAVFHSTNQSYKVSMIQAIINIFNIICIGLLYIFTDIHDLILLGIIYISTSIIIIMLSTVHMFKSYHIKLSPKIIYFEKRYLRELFNIGFKFLFLQISIIVLFNTDNLLISRFIGVGEVTGYQLVYKILSIYTIILSIILTPLWTLILQLSSMGNYAKIKSLFGKIIFLFFLLTLFVLITAIFTPEIIYLWVGGKVTSINVMLLSTMVVFTIFHMWCNMFQALLNGLNLLNIQIYTYGVATIINIPISVGLVLNTNFGVSAIILGTIISLSVPSIILPIYTLRKLRQAR